MRNDFLRLMAQLLTQLELLFNCADDPYRILDGEMLKTEIGRDIQENNGRERECSGWLEEDTTEKSSEKKR